jgi:hypothetical protein
MDLRAATGTTEHAMDLTPAALKEILVMRASGSYGDSLEKAGESIFAGAKALELQGAFSHKDKNGSAVPYVQSQLDLMRRVATATQGRVNFNDYLAVNQQAGMAVSNYSDEYRYKDRPLMMMEYKRAQGGSAVKWGTIEAAIYSNLIQGSMSKAAAMRLERDHILEPGATRLCRIPNSGLKNMPHLRFWSRTQKLQPSKTKISDV